MKKYKVILRFIFKGGNASSMHIVEASNASIAFVAEYNRVVKLYKGKNIILSDIEVEEQ